LTYRPTADDVPNGRCHVDVDPNDIVAFDGRNLVLHTLSFAPVLFGNDPHTTILDLRVIFRGVLRHHEFQPLHGPQSPFKCFAGLEEMVHVGIAECLYGEDSIVGGLVVVWGLGKVGEH